MHEAWQEKRSFSGTVGNRAVDDLYDQAVSAGAIGGKLLGAGGGGFLLLFVPPENQPRVRQRLNSLIHVPFEFETAGSQIIFYEPGEDFSAQEIARNNQIIQPDRELNLNGIPGQTVSA